MRILGIETSCDETSFALLDVGRDGLHLRTHVVSSQIAIHKKYGGIVPEIAARKHSEVFQPLLEKSIGRKDVASSDIIAVTVGPGLITSLMIGVQAAKTLSYAFHKPLVGINHLEAHIYSVWLDHPELFRDPKKYFPAIVLLVSGGHTEFILMRGHGKYELLGQTLDDAAGEAFDKVAKILELGYPGGPAISKIAKAGNSSAIKFPRPMMQDKGYDVSFSGLKTSVLYYLQKKKVVQKKELPDIAASFQQAVIDTLMAKVKHACDKHRPRSLMLVGGVSANKELRSAFQKLGQERGAAVFAPSLEFTGDNAAMVAVAGYFRRKEASRSAWKDLASDAQLQLIA